MHFKKVKMVFGEFGGIVMVNSISGLGSKTGQAITDRYLKEQDERWTAE